MDNIFSAINHVQKEGRRLMPNIGIKYPSEVYSSLLLSFE